MKNKGFTLIELLAVIVILAIIALIATPIILGIINDARTEAKKRSAELAYSGVEYAITSYMYKNGGDVPTKVSDLKNFFKAENVELADATDASGTIKETSKGATKLCDVTVAAGVFTVDCGEYMASKTIDLSTAKSA